MNILLKLQQKFHIFARLLRMMFDSRRNISLEFTVKPKDVRVRARFIEADPIDLQDSEQATW